MSKLIDQDGCFLFNKIIIPGFWFPTAIVLFPGAQLSRGIIVQAKDLIVEWNGLDEMERFYRIIEKNRKKIADDRGYQFKQL